MLGRQIVWLTDDATEFVAPCEICLSESRRELGFIAARRFSRVEGRLLRAADVGFTTCSRGHRILVRRAHGPAAALRR